MNLIDDLKIRFGNGDVLTRIILINIAVFLVINFGKLFAWIGVIEPSSISMLVNKISFAIYLPKLITQPWGILTYMFVHEGLGHIFWNMIVFYWVGQLILEYIGAKKLLSIYLLGGFFAIVFMSIILNSMQWIYSATGKPVDLIHPFSYALGASGSINACLVAIATLIPEYSISLILIGPVRLKYIAVVVVILSLINIPNGNAGGEIAHIGGALFGYLYTRQLQNGNDLGGWLTKLIERFYNPSRNKLKVAYKRTNATTKFNQGSKYDEATIDRILDKISKSGYNSLSKEEKDILFNASDKKS
jgi:membrane associated rhomboid family serine protease